MTLINLPGKYRIVAFPDAIPGPGDPCSVPLVMVGLQKARVGPLEEDRKDGT